MMPETWTEGLTEREQFIFTQMHTTIVALAHDVNIADDLTWTARQGLDDIYPNSK